jgi:phosphate/sulfate permease
MKMEPTSSAIGLVVIVALYVTIGVMSAAGSVYISKSIFSPKVEQIFFGLFLIPIAGFYLAFTAYFADRDTWRKRSRRLVARMWSAEGSIENRQHER